MGAAVITAVGALLGGTAAVIGAVKGQDVPDVVAPPAPTIEPVKPGEEKKPITEAPEVAKDLAKEAEKKRRRARTKTLLTGPRGVLTEAPVARKTLLGE